MSELIDIFIRFFPEHKGMFKASDDPIDDAVRNLVDAETQYRNFKNRTDLAQAPQIFSDDVIEQQINFKKVQTELEIRLELARRYLERTKAAEIEKQDKAFR